MHNASMSTEYPLFTLCVPEPSPEDRERVTALVRRHAVSAEDAAELLHTLGLSEQV